MKRTVCLLLLIAMMGLTSYDNILNYGIKKLMAGTRMEKPTTSNQYRLRIGHYGPMTPLTCITIRPML